MNPDTSESVFAPEELQAVHRPRDERGRAGDTEFLSDPRQGMYEGGDFTIEYDYDDLDRLIRGRMPRNVFAEQKPEVLLVYDKRGNNLRRINPDGGVEEFVYDARNRQVRSIATDLERSFSETTRYEYDAAGNMVVTTPPGSGRIVYGYDALNRRTSEEHPDGGIKRYFYDANDNLLFEDAANGFRTFYNYTPMNQLARVRDAEGGITEFGYDELGN
ncbi:RHS repeat domain-containing protein [Spirochaeta africana]|uniref:RHS repeat domain-containing protein n=1 Tax=Spirochaeta africana TaxID=46355 RepID=UPI00024729A2|nr:RHS repeat protein [Spirochaeta africana]